MNVVISGGEFRDVTVDEMEWYVPYQMTVPDEYNREVVGNPVVKFGKRDGVALFDLATGRGWHGDSVPWRARFRRCPAGMRITITT